MEIGISDVIWLLLLVALLLPWLQRRLRERARTKMLRRIEKERKSRVILLVHRQETIALLGLPLFRYIDINDAEDVIRAIRLTDADVPIDLVLQTPGGLALACVQIARAMQAHRGKVSVLVPHFALSGGTLLALAADEIVMDSHAVLGPVDPQMGRLPAASIVKIPLQKAANEIDDETLIKADMATKALAQMRAEVVELIGEKMPPHKAAAIAERLSQGYWTHDHPIGFPQARNLGLPVNSDMPKAVYDLMKLFPQPARRQPSVQYVPKPYRRSPDEAEGE